MSIILTATKVCFIVRAENCDPMVFTILYEAHRMAKLLTEEDGVEYTVERAGLDPYE